jgi:hypothetical protein
MKMIPINKMIEKKRIAGIISKYLKTKQSRINVSVYKLLILKFFEESF